ncbi:MAG: RNA-binding S4 domain-containing protein [Burkholderiaceae bacterium]|nr:RNA-binding S4 domain-containing protein [Burkholderiaceae bacterium]
MGLTTEIAEVRPVRLDKWLWAARFYKTRGLAQVAIEKGQVLVAGERVKVSRMLKAGERLSIVQGETERQVEVAGLSDVRRAAPLAQALYRERPESIARRQEQARLRKLYREPAREIFGRPTKRDRRELQRVRELGGAGERGDA